MIRNYFKTAIRSFFRNKLFSLINIGGLAIGLAASFVIFQYVRYHLSYDDFHEDTSQIFRVTQETGFKNGEVFNTASTYLPVGPLLMEELPEVTNQCRVYYLDRHAIVAREDRLFEQPAVAYADPTFFALFKHTFLEGTPDDFGKPNTVAISEAVATRYFGDQSPIGKFLRLTEEWHDVNLLVTGVYKDQHPNTHLRIEMVASLSTIEYLPHNIENQWNWPFYLTYIKLIPNVDRGLVASKLPALVSKYFTENTNQTGRSLLLQPLREIHLYSDLQYEAVPNGNAYFVYLLLTIGVVTLSIAYANYINISSARAVERVKEIGIRKALGSVRRNLISQFMVEAGLFNVTALLLAAATIVVSNAYFGEITGVPITTAILGEPSLWLAILGCILLGTIISSFYPVQILSAIRTTNMLKGGSWLSGTVTRRWLVVFQYTASASLLVVSYIILQQMRFIKEQPLGIDIEHVLVVKGPRILSDKYDNEHLSFKQSVLTSSRVRNASLSSSVPGIWTGKVQGVHIAGTSGRNNSYSTIGVDSDFMDSYGLALIAGRPFDNLIEHDSGSVIITLQAMKQLGIADPHEAVGRQLMFGSRTAQVIGVADDYHHFSMKQHYEPIILFPESHRPEYISIAFSSAETDPREALSELEAVWKRHYPGNPFEYFFLSQSYAEQYSSEATFEKIVAIFTGLSIFISGMGLFGLSTFTLSKRKKEIGIRKVLGATSTRILTTIGGDFLKLVSFGCILALPLTYFCSRIWLERFAFRIELSWWHFVLPVACVVCVASATVAYQTVRAAASNPVDAIKCE